MSKCFRGHFIAFVPIHRELRRALDVAYWPILCNRRATFHMADIPDPGLQDARQMT